MIRVYDEADNVIEKHEHAGDLSLNGRSGASASLLDRFSVYLRNEMLTY